MRLQTVGDATVESRRPRSLLWRLVPRKRLNEPVYHHVRVGNSAKPNANTAAYINAARARTREMALRTSLHCALPRSGNRSAGRKQANNR
jgi:hypothetical protein